MKTPAGFECVYFFGNYFRGRKREECRIINPESTIQWTPDLCKTCPVPAILRANACPNLLLRGKVEKTMLGLKKRMKITAFCNLSQKFVSEPEIGCGQCHPLPEIFRNLEK
jgi:hypothetical protein